MRIATCLLALSLGLVAPARVLAQAPGAPAIDADDAFHKGRDAMTRGDYKTALELLRESHKAVPGRGKLTNIAICEARLGLVGSATRHIRELIQQLPPGDERVAMLKKEEAAIAPKVPYLRIELAPAVPVGTAVMLDGEALAAASLVEDIPVDAGKHLVMVTVGGQRAREYQVVLTAGARKMVMVEPAPLPSGAPAPVMASAGAMAPADAPAPADGPARRSTAWILGVTALGVGGASLVVGAVTGIVAVNKDASLEGKCKDGHCLPNTEPVLADRTLFANVSTGTVIAGGVLAAAGVVLVVTSGRRQSSSAWVTPVIGPGTLGVQGRF